MHTNRRSTPAFGLVPAFFAALAIGTIGGIGAIGLTPAVWAGDFRLEKRLPLAAGGSFALSSEASGVKVRGGEGTEAVDLIASERADFAEVFNVRFETASMNDSAGGRQAMFSAEFIAYGTALIPSPAS